MNLDSLIDASLLVLVGYFGWKVSRHLNDIAKATKARDEELKTKGDKLAAADKETNYRMGMDHQKQAHNIRRHELDLERSDAFNAGRTGEYERGVLAEHQRSSSRPTPLHEAEGGANLDFSDTQSRRHDDNSPER